jgi:long-chain acyl-CoA synthetase
VREYTTPDTFTVADGATLTDALFANAARVPDKVIIRYKVGENFRGVTAKEFADRVERVAAGLVARGVRPGERVAIMSRTRFEWTVVDYAAWVSGAVSVPIYETSSAEQVEWILQDAGVVLAVVETARHADLVEQVLPGTPALRHVLVIDDGALDTLAAEGADVTAEELARQRDGVTADSLATIIYTSGTTGRPKGCELTHRALVFDADASIKKFPDLFAADGNALLFLPLAHVYARVLAICNIQGALDMAYVPDPSTLLADLPKVRPTFLLAVPRVFEKVHAGARNKAHTANWVKGMIFDMAENVAIAYSRSLDTGGPALDLKLRHALFDVLVYSRLRAALGGRIECAVSGGAPLGERLGHFFRGIGLTVLEGYGLTETSAVATANRVGAARIGTVGQPLPGVTVRIADDGEVLIRGPMLFRGYRNNDIATKEALDGDGFLHTGDIGTLDDGGYLRITGRKKELLVTAGGKNVAPAPLEHLVKAHPLVSQVMVVGDRRPFVAALVTLDPDALPGWKAAHGKPAGARVDDLRTDPALLADIQTAVDAANQSVSKAESIREFVVLPNDFTVEGGELTPSLKVKRNVVMERYAKTIEKIYA